jgi:hypothetical protein
VGYAGGPNVVSQIWRNTGLGFSNINAGLPPVTIGAAAWGDYDNDGLLDLAITGTTPKIAQVWRNTGGGFTNINAGLIPLSSSSVAWGDYDNDGLLDLALTGDNGTNYASYVWRNTGNGFTNINAPLPGSGAGPAGWGDCDNDGRLDLLIAGHNVTQVWRNTTNGFIETPASLPAMINASVSWGDYDNDGRLDILLSEGTIGVGAVAGVWRNSFPNTNTPPAMPENLAATPTPTGAALSWGNGKDTQTPSSGLSYNIRVGTTPGGFDIVSPEANTTNGLRKLAALGNAQMRTNALLNLPLGRYYWSVQTIDTAFAGSSWAPEQSFVVGGSRFTHILPQAPGAFKLGLLGYVGRTYQVQAAPDLSWPSNQWQKVTNITIGPSGVYPFIDSAAGTATKFYRAVPQ